MDDTEIEIKKLKKRVTDLEEYTPDDANNTISQQTFNKAVDFRDKMKIPNRSATPATCRVGEMVEVGGTFYSCTAADTWTALGGGSRYVIFKVLSPNTIHTVANTVGGDLEMPVDGTITEIGAFVDTAGTTGSGTIDVNLNGTTLMSSTKITIETGEKSSRDATTQPVLTTTAVTVGDIITVDIDAIQTTPASGLTIRFTLT